MAERAEARRCRRGWYRVSSASVSRVASISRPKGTADGQAVSQPRHCTQVSITSMKGRRPAGHRGAPGAWPRCGPGASSAPPRRPEGGAVGQAQPAGDAGGELVLVDRQLHSGATLGRGWHRAAGRGQGVAARVEAAAGVEHGLDPAVQLDHLGTGRRCRRRRAPMDHAHPDLRHEGAVGRPEAGRARRAATTGGAAAAAAGRPRRPGRSARPRRARRRRRRCTR